jgi:hypothetical protein
LKAGDIMIVETGCVHQHFNDDPENEAVLLVLSKAALPLHAFAFQKTVTYPPTTLLKATKTGMPTDL